MNSVTIFFLLFVTFTFANIFNIGGTNCIPDDATTCTARTGSEHVMLTGGANVDDAGVITAGTADTYGVSVAFTIPEDGFYGLSLVSLGGTDAAALIWADEADLTDATTAWAATNGNWYGLMMAGDYVAVITANNGAADACGEFTATLAPNYYDTTGMTDTWIQNCAFGDDFFGALVTFTPEADGFYTGFGVGTDADGEDRTVLHSGLVFATADLPANISDCNATETNMIPMNLTYFGYPLTAATEYTFVFKDSLNEEAIKVWLNWNMWMEPVDPVYTACDNLDYADQVDFIRPNIDSYATHTECEVDETNPSEFNFDVRYSMYDTDVFVVVDTVSCGDLNDDRVPGDNFDGACVLYYGHVGSERDGDTPAVAPESCEDFIIAGDSGDGGAVYYWFPANAGLTIVPTTYNSGDSGVYHLLEGTYDIVGCVPENPYLPAEPTGETDNAIVAVVSSVFFLLALF